MNTQQNRWKEDIASIGIGALIIFIAIILVAGIAASVLVQTSTRLEMQALRTGSETITETSTGLKVMSTLGYNSSNEITKLVVEITLLAGSNPIDLGQTIIELSDSSSKQILSYGNILTNASSVNGDIFMNGAFGDETSFGIVVFQDNDLSCTQHQPVINYGDHVGIGINTTAIFDGIIPRTSINGMIICEQGSAGIIGFTTPSSYTKAVMELQ
jgi:flagellin FlaB